MTAEPQRHVVASTDGVSVVAWDHGGAGPAAVFCHATGFHGRYWDPICRRLADRFRCVAIDLRGHGDSVVPEGVELVWQGMADDILAVVDALELGQELRGVGHSMGGASIVIAELTRSGTFASAWLCEPIIAPAEGGPFRAPGDNPLADSARRRREVFASRDEAFERYASRPPFSSADPEALRAYVDHGFRDQPDGTVILKCRGATEAAVFEQARNGAFARLDEMLTRTTVVGSGDGFPPAIMAPMVAAALPNGALEPMPDLTHFAPMEDPARIAASIAAALA
jgi:pimeloyl-ACP methyl ester carboxylesterase